MKVSLSKENTAPCKLETHRVNGVRVWRTLTARARVPGKAVREVRRSSAYKTRRHASSFGAAFREVGDKGSWEGPRAAQGIVGGQGTLQKELAVTSGQI